MATNEETIILGLGNQNQNNSQTPPPRPNTANAAGQQQQPRPQQPQRPQQAYRPAYQPQSSDSSQTWMRVVVGGVAGILFGSVSAVGASAAYQHFANGEEPEPEVDVNLDDVPVTPENEGHYTMSNGLEVAEVSDSMSFGEAFAAARAEVGPGGVFVWHGGVYGTYTADEWNSMSTAEHNEFAQLSQPAISENVTAAPANNVDVVHHEPDVHIHNAANGDDDVSIVGVEEVTLSDGSTATLAQANVDGHDVYMVDVDQDGTFDVAAMDANGNGQLDDNEVMDISGQGMGMSGGSGMATTVSDPSTDDGLLTDASMGSDGMPDYMNDAGGDLLV